MDLKEISDQDLLQMLDELNDANIKKGSLISDLLSKLDGPLQLIEGPILIYKEAARRWAFTVIKNQ